jgi:methylglutaconyl-CoA hydratase
MSQYSNLIELRVDEPSGTVTLNRPEVLNALSLASIRELTQAISDLHLERRVRAIILSGSGESFCSGTDLQELKETYELESPYERWYEEVTAFKELTELILRCPKPVIAAVNGWVAGTGLALMLAADLVVASEDCRLWVPEPLRGLSAGLTTPLLSFRLGNSSFHQSLFTGTPVPVKVAAGKGLIHEVVPNEYVWARSQEIAREIAGGARESHQMTKRMLNESIGENLFTLLSLGAADMATARITDAAKEGVQAFLEKRAPNWK